jgi:AcrR family transcriptional regulator
LKPTKSPRKPKGSGHLRRSEILDVAQKIFAEEGYHGATVRKIAEQVGVSSTAIYLHFPDKRAMLLEIAAVALEPLLTEARVIAADRGVDPRQRAAFMMQAYMRFAVENPSAYAVLMSGGQQELADSDAPAQELFTAYHSVFLGVIAELAEQNRLYGVRSHVVAQTLWAGCHGVISLIQNNPNLRWAPYLELRDTMIDGLLSGLVDERR